jgi:hypothetical protein
MVRHFVRLDAAGCGCSFGIRLALVDCEDGLRRNDDDPKEKPVSEKSAARYARPVSLERKPLATIDPEFLRDLLEALLSSHVVANSGHPRRGSGLTSGDADQAGSDTTADDARLLRDALLAVGRSA